MNDRPGIAAALAEAAALLADLPSNLPAPYVTAGSWGYADVHWQLMHDAEVSGQKLLAAAVIRALGGKWDKDPGETFSFRQARGGLRLTVSVDRPAVCQPVVTGTETVTIPAVEAQPERTEVREIVEWRCEPLLADADAVTA